MNKLESLPDSINSASGAAVSFEKPESVKIEGDKEVTDSKSEVSKAELAKVESPDLNEVVTIINDLVQTMQRDISFSVDKHSGREVISVFETDTKKLIRQIPSEETLELLKNLDQIKGVLFKTEA